MAFSSFTTHLYCDSYTHMPGLPGYNLPGSSSCMDSPLDLVHACLPSLFLILLCCVLTLLVSCAVIVVCQLRGFAYRAAFALPQPKLAQACAHGLYQDNTARCGLERVRSCLHTHTRAFALCRHTPAAACRHHQFTTYLPLFSIAPPHGLCRIFAYLPFRHSLPPPHAVSR